MYPVSTMALARVHYFEGRGLCEMARLSLAASGVAFEEVPIKSREDWAKLQASGILRFGQVPLVQVDGKNLIQSTAIVRYFARMYGMYGDSDDEANAIDEISAGLRDYLSLLTDIPFSKNRAADLDVVRSKLPRYFGATEAALRAQPEAHQAYLVGAKLSFADLYLLDVGDYLVNFLGEDALAAYPLTRAAFRKVAELPRIAAYLSSSQRHPLPGPAYVAAVNHILEWD